MADKTTRINFNATPEQKKELVRLAKKNNMTLTDFIIMKCLTDDPAEHYQTTIKDMELNHLQEKHDSTQRQLSTLQQEYDDLKALYKVTHNAMLWHSLPFYKKLGKQLELPNKQDD